MMIITEWPLLFSISRAHLAWSCSSRLPDHGWSILTDLFVQNRDTMIDTRSGEIVLGAMDDIIPYFPPIGSQTGTSPPAFSAFVDVRILCTETVVAAYQLAIDPPHSCTRLGQVTKQSSVYITGITIGRLFVGVSLTPSSIELCTGLQQRRILSFAYRSVFHNRRQLFHYLPTRCLSSGIPSNLQLAHPAYHEGYFLHHSWALCKDKNRFPTYRWYLRT